MKRVGVGVLIAALMTVSLQVAQAEGPPARYIVVLRDSVRDPATIANEHARANGAQVSHVYRYALKGYAASMSSTAAARVAQDSRVDFVEPDLSVHALNHNISQTLPTGVNRIEGDLSSTLANNHSGSVNVAVAVIDTGSGPHDDLNVVGGKNCSQGKSYNDGNGHGTHVAGTIAAKDDGVGVVGVAPGAPIYSVRVLNNSGSGTWSSVICGIDWVTANASARGIKVANMSLGGSGSDGTCGSSSLHKAICNSVAGGTTYAVAAGNSGADFATSVPATYNEVLTVTAVADFNGLPGGGAAPTCRSDVDDTAADFSNFTSIGSSDAAHTIAAPGACIESTWKGGGYNTISGTSMASPHAAGAAALCIAGPCFGFTPARVMDKLRADAQTETNDANLVYYGFAGDPNIPNGSRYYGYLAYAGGY